MNNYAVFIDDKFVLDIIAETDDKARDQMRHMLRLMKCDDIRVCVDGVSCFANGKYCRFEIAKQ